MSTTPRRAKRNESGSVAIEFVAVMLFLLVPVLAGALFFGRFVWHYTVAEKAAHDAAKFVASASPTELKTQCPTLYRDPCIVTAAMNLAYAEIAELNPGGDDLPQVRVYCDNGTCYTNKGTDPPKQISVGITMTVEDPILSLVTSLFTGGTGPVAIPINATARSYYVGN
jgi:Flp pilus assembly protein TadG